MSIAFKCDRCKKCFDPNDIFGTTKFTLIDEIRTQNRLEFQKHVVGTRKEAIHLCPSCTKAFESFMESGKPFEPRFFETEGPSQKLQPPL